MQYSLLIILVLAHIAGEFVLQSDASSARKHSGGRTALIWTSVHGLIIMLLSWLVAWSWAFLPWALLIGVSHLVIDLVTGKASRSPIGNRAGMWSFLADQALHMAVLAAVAYLASQDSWTDWSSGYNMSGVLDVRLLLIAAFVCTKPANIAINEHLRKLDRSVNNSAALLIGSFERLLVLLLALFGEYTAIAIIFVGKCALMRRPDSKPEYVLVGTLMSYCIAIACGILLKVTIG